MPGDEPWGYDGPPSDLEARNLYAQTHQKRSAPKPKPKRTGKTPEAKVSDAIDDYLTELDFYVIRTSAGFTRIEDRAIQIGRKGQHDRTCCAPNGRFVSIEIKSATGTPSPAQLRQRDFIMRRNGIVIIPHGVAELRAGLVAAFSEQVVSDWEKLGRARKR